jgi:hypothetical protein
MDKHSACGLSFPIGIVDPFHRMENSLPFRICSRGERSGNRMAEDHPRTIWRGDYDGCYPAVAYNRQYRCGSDVSSAISVLHLEILLRNFTAIAYV